MEPTAAGKSRSRILAVGVIVLCVLGVVAAAITYTSRRLHRTPLVTLVRADLPVLDLRLKLVDADGEEIAADRSRLARATAAAPQADPAGCPALAGGDQRVEITPPEGTKSAHCPPRAIWAVRHSPLALTLSFSRPEKILPLLEQNGPFRSFLESRFTQGVLHAPKLLAALRAEDLGLTGLQGTFLAMLARESLAAQARLHYDISHGRRGFVYSFVRDQCPYAAKALPVIARVLTRSAYRVPGLGEPVLEMRIGLQRLFLAEDQGRVYVGNGLEALLNVLDQAQVADDPAGAPLVLTMRGEAFVDHLPRLLTGGPVFPVDLGFGLAADTPDYLQIPGGPYARHLRPRIFKGVLAAIPHDAFAALATSFHLPPDLPDAAWRELADRGPSPRPGAGPDEAGVAVIWDLSARQEGSSALGVAVATQTTPGQAGRLADLFAKPELTDQCGGGTVFLAATTRPLLTRMKEACERQSLSILDWERGARAEALHGSQLLALINPGVGMRELFLAGGAGDPGQTAGEERRVEQYRDAKAALRRECEPTFARLPIFAFAGTAAPEAGTIRLAGMHISQGAAK